MDAQMLVYDGESRRTWLPCILCAVPKAGGGSIDGGHIVVSLKWEVCSVCCSVLQCVVMCCSVL